MPFMRMRHLLFHFTCRCLIEMRYVLHVACGRLIAYAALLSQLIFSSCGHTAKVPCRCLK